jgi:hypothetical protein
MEHCTVCAREIKGGYTRQGQKIDACSGCVVWLWFVIRPFLLRKLEEK